MEKNYLCQEPIVYTINNVLTPEECEHFINVSKSDLKRAEVAGNNGGFISTGRSGQNCWIAHNKDDVFKRIAEKISKIVGYPLHNAESFQLIYYDKNQEYYNHYDSWKFDGSEKSKRCLLRGGQRMVTALVYLNDVEEGGDTKFVRLNLSVNPEKGKLLVFHNCYEGTNIVHELTEHAGTPVKKGEKYAFNLWFRQQSKKIDYVHKY